MTAGNLIALKVQLLVLGFGELEGLLEKQGHLNTFYLQLSTAPQRRTGYQETFQFNFEYERKGPLTEFSLKSVTGIHEIPGRYYRMQQQFGVNGFPLLDQAEMKRFFHAMHNLRQKPVKQFVQNIKKHMRNIEPVQPELPRPIIKKTK